jgi:poly-gamma-glutamate synthesis protein (capsule biosynthesis protein)
MRSPVTLAFAGDVMLGRGVAEMIRTRGPASLWGDVRPAIAAADAFPVKLECALTHSTERWLDDGHEKAFYFRADPSAVDTLRAAPVTFAATANNHAGDFGIQGLLETGETLRRAGIATTGSGPDCAAAASPARLRVRGWRVNVVAFADHHVSWAAAADRPGISYTPIDADPAHFAVVERAIARAREDADLVVFCIHWGPNMRARPTPAFHQFARRVIDSGADIFWGHSAHIVQGIEFWRDRLILYDTGDFVDDYATDELLRNDLSALFLVTIDPSDRQRLRLVPVRVGYARTTVAEPHGPDWTWFVERLTDLCREMGTGVSPERGGLLGVSPVVRGDEEAGPLEEHPEGPSIPG